jgi:crossover junction endodeoxyribonuclease RusA
MPSHRRRFISRSSKLQFLEPPQDARKPLLQSSHISQPAHSTAAAPMPAPPRQQAPHQPFAQPPMITADTLNVTLPVPPSINQQYATVNGRRLLSSAGRAFKKHVSQHVWIVLTQSTRHTPLKTRLQSGPLALTIRFFFASALRRDLDSGLKIAQDAVCESLGINDNRITETHLYKHVDRVAPRIEVSLSLIASPSQPA